MTTPGRTTKAASSSASTAWSRCGWRSTRRGTSIIAARRSRGRSGRRSTTGRRWPAARSATNWPTTANTRPRPTPRGEVHFKLPTREFSETQLLPLRVALPERNLTTAVNFMLAAQGFSIGVSTVRPVYLAGETFEVAVNTRDAEGKPTEQKLRR